MQTYKEGDLVHFQRSPESPRYKGEIIHVRLTEARELLKDPIVIIEARPGYKNTGWNSKTCEIRMSQITGLIQETNSAPPFRIRVEVSGEELSRLGYPIIVEMWDKKSFGKGRRLWLEQFTEKERHQARAIYEKAYTWHLRTGVPDYTTITESSWGLLHKMIQFFGTL